MSTANTNAPQEQISYANLLFYGCWGGLAVMFVTYLVYLTGLFSPHVPVETVIQLWSKPVNEYLSVGQVPIGWGWAGLLGKGDFLNFLGIALLAGMTIICYIPVIFAYMKKKDMVYALLALAEVIVLGVAASGIVGGGAH